MLPLHMSKVIVYLICLLIMLKTMHSWILRLPCKEEGQFDVISRDQSLLNNLLESLTVSSLEDCFESCRLRIGCKSVNHKNTGENNCELNSKTAIEGSSGDLQPNASWTYYATNYSKKNIGSYCELFKPCHASEYCIDTCSCPGFRCFRCNHGYFLNRDMECAASSKSCNEFYMAGERDSKKYILDEIEAHYCMMDGGCGKGGWTLALKADGTTGALSLHSPYWEDERVLNAWATNMNPGDAKFEAFNKMRFTAICIGMKMKHEAEANWLSFPISSSSLRGIFSSSTSIHLNLPLSKWYGLIPGPTTLLQPNCHRQGINIRKDYNNILISRIGIMGNNENECMSPDSAIGIGLNRATQSSGSYYLATIYSRQAYIFIQ